MTKSQKVSRLSLNLLLFVCPQLHPLHLHILVNLPCASTPKASSGYKRGSDDLSFEAAHARTVNPQQAAENDSNEGNDENDEVLLAHHRITGLTNLEGFQ